MSGKKHASKVVIYKLCKHTSRDARTTLKTRLDKSLKQLQTIGDRRFNVGTDGDPCFHIISTPQLPGKNDSAFTFGTLITYTPGKDSLFIVDDEDASDILLEQLSANLTEKGKRREFLESLIYFCVKGNHIALIQSPHLKANHLAKYLVWLLKKSGEINADDDIFLLDTPPKHQQERLAKAKGVTSISFSSKIEPPESAGPGENLDLFSGEIKGRGNSLYRALESFIKPSASSVLDFSRIRQANIKMGITFELDKDTTDGGQSLMDYLGAILRETDDIDPILELKGGGTIRGSMLKLNGVIRVSSYSGQLSASEVYGELKSWLSGVLEQKANL